jgi:hypothetical protein
MASYTDMDKSSNPSRLSIGAGGGILSAGPIEGGGGMETPSEFPEMMDTHQVASYLRIKGRFDLAIDRRAYFESPVQALLAFTRTVEFAAKAEALGGYDISGIGSIRWNAP